MNKFISYEKLSKKKQREFDSARRATWGEINPVTRTSQDSKTYQRKKARQWKDDPTNPEPFCCAG